MWRFLEGTRTRRGSARLPRYHRSDTPPSLPEAQPSRGRMPPLPDSRNPHVQDSSRVLLGPSAVPPKEQRARRPSTARPALQLLGHRLHVDTKRPQRHTLTCRVALIITNLNRRKMSLNLLLISLRFFVEAVITIGAPSFPKERYPPLMGS